MLYAEAEEGNATGLGLASELAKLSGYYALVGGAPRHTVVVVFVCLSVCVILQHAFLHDCDELSNGTCNAIISQHSTTAKLARFLI